jgi:hypothetical protein
MGKNKSTKSDGVQNFTNTQDLGNKKRISRGAVDKSLPTSKPK